jgi:hypothetical protein
MKLQFKDRLITAQADSSASAGSIMLILQSEESTAGVLAAGASALQSSSATLLFRDDIENAYQFYIQEWEIHEKWLELDSKAYDIMRRHTEDDCKPVLGTGTSFEV